VTLKRAGMPTTGVMLAMKVPSLDLVRWRSVCSPHGLPRLRRLLEQWLPVSEEAREGATFTLSAEIRHRDNQGYRWIVLSRWRGGESVNRALEEALTNWKPLAERRRLLEYPTEPNS